MHYIGKILILSCGELVHYSCLYDTIIQGYFWWKRILVSRNFDCISRLWRWNKLVLSPHRNLCWGFPTMVPETFWDVNFLIARRRVHCLGPCSWGASAWHHRLGGWFEDVWCLRSAWLVGLGGWGEAFCKLQNVSYLEW